MANDSHARMDGKKLRHALNYGFGPFAIRRWIYVPQVPDRRNLRFAVDKALSKEYAQCMRVFEYEYFVNAFGSFATIISDAYAMLDMYDGITLIREENDK